MEIQLTEKNIQQNKTDLLVSAARSIVGIAPFVGPLLSELVGTLIPNQRIDRLAKFVKELDEKLSDFEEEFLRTEIEKEECSDLFEEGFIQASRALSDERRSYIASIIANGLKNEHIEYAESKHLMYLLQELNDIEVIWLRFYYGPTIGGDEEFREKHKNVLEPVPSYLGADQHLLDKNALQESYKAHLERLGLIQPHYNIDRESGIPEFDNFTGKPKVSYYDVSPLGRLLLKNIGLINDEEG